MLGFSLSKLVVLALIVGAVWYGFRWLQRRQLPGRPSGGKVGRRPAAPSHDLAACERCGVFVPVSGGRRCDRADCPG